MNFSSEAHLLKDLLARHKSLTTGRFPFASKLHYLKQPRGRLKQPTACGLQ